ncbi:MAG: 16S rRNA (uracil(1498)-N(3))-methyltransferase [Burkholderiaceae bacterium]
MAPRFFVDRALNAGDAFALPPGPARHVQVQRLQPGAVLRLFNGAGGDWDATVAEMGRSDVKVTLGAHAEVDVELPVAVTLALGMPANDRMDAVVEKATELGVGAIQPLVCDRSVLRLAGERALKKAAHWQAVALAACEQCGRTRVPRVEPVVALTDWLRGVPQDGRARWVLSLSDDAGPVASMSLPPDGVVCLSGPEGGLTAGEESLARQAGFAPVSLGPRVLRADTAPLALLAHLGLSRASGPCR